MQDPKGRFPKFSDLRRRAEARLQAEAVPAAELYPGEATRLIHELRVHQIELEMQNEELRQAQVLVEESRGKYADLYDFAPISYLTVDERGQILEANLTAASLLGVERTLLLGKFFPLFLVESDRRDFRQLLKNKVNQQEFRGEFKLQNVNGGMRTMQLDILFLQDGQGRERRRLTLTDITELKQAQEKLRQLTRQLLTFQELERQRIAGDIHDEMGQSLMALKMKLNAVKRSFRSNKEAWEEFDQAVGFVDVIAEQTREICQTLRPSALENLGLNGALRQLLAKYEKHHGLEVLDELADLSGLFSSETQIAVYRLFQECLTNATRHGRATSITVRAHKGDGAVSFICEDNGTGFDLEEVRSQSGSDQGLGLATMEERVRLLQGSFKITSAQGKGTRIDVTLPLSPDINQV